MAFKVCSIASGSKGNCLYISSGKTKVLIDCGIPLSSICKGLKEADGVDISEIDAVLVTHEHIDHIRSLSYAGEIVPVYAHNRAFAAIEARAPLGRAERIDFFDTPFNVGDIEVVPFRVPHDASYPVGFSLLSGGVKVSVATDLGCITKGVLSNIEGSDLAVLEANHDERMLRAGKYPERLKQRILGKSGHLSNMIAGLTAAELLKSGIRNIILGHLSEENNTPELAYASVRSVLERSGAEVGKDVTLTVASQRQISDVIYVEKAGRMLKSKGKDF